MERRTISVPKGVRFISSWTQPNKDGYVYKLSDFTFPHILNKKVTGCGFTEYCIRNNQNIILCSPRKVLLENKKAQHPEVFYFQTLDEEMGFDKNIADIYQKLKDSNTNTTAMSLIPGNVYSDEGEDAKRGKRRKRQENGKTEKLGEISGKLKSYIIDSNNHGEPVKILVTYDSFRIVKDILTRMGLFDRFYVVVDESQSIFVDSRFKSSTEMEFIDQLKGLQNVCYVSATPMIDNYLEQLDLFKDLPYYEFDWESEDPSRVFKPNLIVKSSDNILKDAISVIKSYLSEHFEYSIVNDPVTGSIKKIESREAVIYVNSVTNICRLIKRCKLTPYNTNILCSNTPENFNRIYKAFNEVIPKIDKSLIVIGRVPKRGEQHKMFTLCTRTVYLGADFYSTNARSFIFSDANIDSLSVDITLDLPQILGRQRLDENPWKNSAELYFRTILDSRVVTKEDFDKMVEEKVKTTEIVLDELKKMNPHSLQIFCERLEPAVKVKNYGFDYVSINHHAGSVLTAEFNKLVMISEQRAFDIQQINYRDRFSIFNTLYKEGYQLDSNKTDLLRAKFDSLPYFTDKLKYLCEDVMKELNDLEFNSFLDSIPIVFRNSYRALGPEKCKAVSYQWSKIRKELNRKLEESPDGGNLAERVYNYFKEGSRYSLKEIKEFFQDYYDEIGLQVKAKATDLNKFFETQTAKVKLDSGERVDGFTIICRKVFLDDDILEIIKKYS